MLIQRRVFSACHDMLKIIYIMYMGKYGTMWKMEGVKQIVGKDSRYKLFWSGNDNSTGGVGVLLAEEWWERVFEVVRVSDRIILIRMTIGKTVFVFVCVYAPQANLSEFEKDRFYQMLQCTVAKIPALCLW